MSLFGSSAKSKVTVSPSSQVDALLRQIVSNAQGMNKGQFVGREMAGFNQNQSAALSGLANSDVQKQLAALYTPRTQQGLDQMNTLAQRYQSMANGGGVTGQAVNDYSKSLNNSALAQATGKAASNVSLGNGSDSGSLRRASAQGAALASANTNLSRSIDGKNMGINNLQNNEAFQRGILGAQTGLAGQNLNLGAQGVQATQQAIQNQLLAGNLQQQQDQTQANLNWENAIGNQQFGWNQLNNQLNVLNSVSPMAGYTIKNAQPGVSQGQQLLGAGMTGLGIAGRLGAFTPNAQTQNAWNSYNASGGQSGMAGPMIGGSNLSNQQSQNNWLSTAGNNILGGVLGAFGAN
ncbi:hypothetical protein PQC40_gp021 [Escherichia phage EP335]|uniref:DNA injection protein n=1 Tax=Escherichia phage EP335 TaxID=2070199 RepID=A0A2Z3DV09_9CAUD|nr:hypothetical protein PQC40_gp021 [Escherichia phage EP335]AVZ45104.1 hypothetical protein [Escherichia phage EP335]